MRGTIDIRTLFAAAVLFGVPVAAAAGTWYEDADGDGWGDPAITVVANAAPIGYVDNRWDCDDQDPAIRPGAPEICGDLIDNNCDGPWDNTCSPVAVDGASWGAVKGTYR